MPTVTGAVTANDCAPVCCKVPPPVNVTPVMAPIEPMV